MELQPDYGTCFAVRVNKRPEYIPLMEDAMKPFRKVLGVTHTGKNRNNPHWHFIIHTDKNQKSLRYELLKFFNLAKGNGNMGIKPCDGNPKAWSYIFKEHERDTFAVDIQKGYTDEKVQEYLDLHLHYKATIYKGGTKVVQEIYNKMKDQHMKLDAPNIFREIMKHFKDKDWYPNKFTAYKYIMKIQAIDKEDNEREFNKWVDSIYDDWFGHVGHF